MKKSFINLCHHDHVYILKPSIRQWPRLCILPPIPQQLVGQIANFLRLAQIISLYQSVKLNHKHKQFKRSVLNYLILSKRSFSKWEQKQFLDLLLRQSQQKQQPLYYCQKSYNLSNRVSQNQHAALKVQSEKFQQRVDSSKNDNSRLIRFKQSIVYDVDRTYFKRNNNQKKKSIQLQLQKNDKPSQNKSIVQKQTNRKGNTPFQSDQAYPYYITLSTEPPSLKSHPSEYACPKLGYSQSGSNCEDSQTHSIAEFNTLEHMQNFLKNVLIKISHKYPSIGYIQGFNYIAKNMYLTGFQEEEAVRYLSFFVEQRSLGSIISANMSGIKRLSYVLKVYIFNYVPKVYKHLLKSQVQPQFFCTSWFITLFSQDLSVEIVNKLWHLFSLEGWKIFIQFGVALLCAYQDVILSKDLDEIFTFMRRIIQKFNQEAKRRQSRHPPRIWQNNSNREQIVWKLMSSVVVNGSIVNQLCRQMVNLQNDSEIQIWRIQEGQNLYLSRSNITSSERTAKSNGRYRRQRSLSYLTKPPNTNIGSQFCCDRMPNVDPNPLTINSERSRNVFSLCRNIDTCVD